MWLNDTDRLTLIRKNGALEIMLWVLWCLLTHISPNCGVCGRDSLRGLEIPFPLVLPAVFFCFWESRQISMKSLFFFIIQLKSFKSLHADIFSPSFFFCSCVAADIISTVEFNSSGELLATGDKGGRVVVFQREQEVGNVNNATLNVLLLKRSDHFWICALLLYLFYILL